MAAALKQAFVCEKDTENFYRSEFKKALKDAEITSPFNCDGLLQAKDIRTLLEFKYREDLKQKSSQCGVLIQLLYYLKKFEDAGQPMPTTLFVGDLDECFALGTKAVEKYLRHAIDWQIPPSSAASRNPALLRAMVEDEDISAYVHDVNGDFRIRDVIEKLRGLGAAVVRKVRITERNVVTAFDYFNTQVLPEGLNLDVNERVNLFVQVLINPSENFLHPKKQNMLVTRDLGHLRVVSHQFRSFFGHFNEEYSPSEKERLTSFTDRLIHDETRRRKGEFYTPSPFVNLAHQYIENALGEDWRDEYVVWDCCCGTGNLTRDYRFKELYLSTLESSDIATIQQMGYNPEAVKFQFDFLNGTYDELPEGLRQAFESGKKVLFLVNPPYATANNMGTKEGDHKAGVSATVASQAMKAEGWGKSAQNLLAQFLFVMHRLQRRFPAVQIANFGTPIQVSGGSYASFRERFEATFENRGGFLMNASHFDSCANTWGIAFNLFTPKAIHNGIRISL